MDAGINQRLLGGMLAIKARHRRARIGGVCPRLRGLGGGSISSLHFRKIPSRPFSQPIAVTPVQGGRGRSPVNGLPRFASKECEGDWVDVLTSLPKPCGQARQHILDGRGITVWMILNY
jgi:hypothetical protein